ncbi:hypothetical protein HDV00_003274 [Rhizophlyctis rosea]|nr:hypothetical protein HDV00_003274 [Rhizophlyctis rosea]
MKFSAAAALAVLAASSVNAASQPAPLKDLAAKHGIYVGTALSTGYLNDAKWTAIFDREFNMVTPENDMKWEVTEPQPAVFNFTNSDIIVANAKKIGAHVRGHTFVWHSQLANWVTSKTYTKEEMEAIIVRHIRGEAGYYHGQLAQWDVVNELIDDSAAANYRQDPIYGFNYDNSTDFIELAFRTAHEVDPTAKLFINDYNMEGEAPQKSDATYNLIKKLKAKGVPIHGLGAQAHMIVGQVPSTMEATFKKFASLGVDVAITELDIRMDQPFTDDKLAQQGKDYEAVFRACLAVNAAKLPGKCLGVTLWGISDNYSWIPGVFSTQGSALAWDENYQPKPAYDGIVRALTTNPPKTTTTTTTKTTTTTTKKTTTTKAYTKPTARAIRK